ncbi:MAG: DMT family transporter [Chloroflexi bacterium]|nr:DMT family transporter [Chloroflexota bacterium]
MNWFDAAILSPAVMGVTSILDSHILSKRAPSLRFYLLVGGAFHLTWTVIFLSLYPLPSGVSASGFVVTVAAGLLRALAVTIMFNAMRSEEVSRVIPVVFTYPVFVALMAVPLLGERLTYLQWLAIIVVVSGAVMVSIKKSPSGTASWPGKIFLVLPVVSLLYASADVTGKFAVAHYSPLQIVAITEACVALVWLSVALRPGTIREFRTAPWRRSTPAFIVLAETIAPTGILLLLMAMQGGPVSLVSTISGARPIFVAMFALILSRLAPQFLMWSPGKGMVMLRLAATVMIVAGISIIYLT